MLSGAHRFPRQDQVTYGRPAAEVLTSLAKAWGCSRLLITTTASLRDGLAAEMARALGDLSENGDYHAAKEQQGKMEARIRQIKGILLDAKIVEQRAYDGTVAVGSVIGIVFGPGEDPERFLVGHIEERQEGVEVLSPESPMGSQLLGKRAGDTATYEVNGRELTVTIDSVE